MECKTDYNGRPGLSCELRQYGSPTNGTALPFVLEYLLQPTYVWHPTRPHHTSHPPPTSPPPIDSIRDITAIEKLSQKPGAFKYIVCRNSCEIFPV